MRLLVAAAMLLTFIVVVVGAYVRLSDAGLGCPDWPLCYGKPLPEGIAESDALAKAWKEMAHRYLAAALGVLILAIFIFSRRRILAALLLALVVFQAALGMWTVTLLLKPAVVAAHLLGGMAVLSLLVWFALSQYEHRPDARLKGLRVPAFVALGVLLLQIALGGWVSANYAALACPDLPLCRGHVVPPMDFANAFHLLRELGRTPGGELLSLEGLTAIHWTHRVFALIVLAVVGWAAARAYRFAPLLGALTAVLLLIQFSLGLANVAFSLPLSLAAAHNAGAALLLCAVVVLNFFAFRALRPAFF